MHGARSAGRILLAVALVALPLIGLAVLAGDGSPARPASPRGAALGLAPGQGSEAQAVRSGPDTEPGARSAPQLRGPALLAVVLGVAGALALAATAGASRRASPPCAPGATSPPPGGGRRSAPPADTSVERRARGAASWRKPVPRPVLEPRSPVRRRPDTGQRLGVAAAVLVAGLALVAVGVALRGPSFVDGVTVVNESPFDVHVDVRAPGGPALGLGTVPRGRELRFTSVLDQGDTWSFSFSSGGEDGGRVDVARRALEQDGWRLTVPATTESRLERAGLAPAPATRTDDS